MEAQAQPQQPPKKPLILWVSDSPIFDCVGQSRVTREFCRRLIQVFEVGVAGFLHKEEFIQGKTFPYPIVSVDRDKLKEQLPNIIKQCTPDAVVYSHDAFLVGEAITEVRKQCPHTRQVGYFTIDGEPVNQRWRGLFESMDSIIVPSKYGERVIQETWPDLPVEVIPYGVDPGYYHPPTVCTRNELKLAVDQFLTQHNQFKLQTSKFQNNFCVAVVGMNQSRKNIGAAYYAWKEFEKRHSDVCLWILTHPQAPNTQLGSYDLGLMTDLKTGLVLYTTLPEDTYVRMLAACDCFLHPSVGEGFGLPALEAMSSGVVPVVTDFSATTDFCTPETSYPLSWVPVVGEFNTIRAVVDTAKLVETLEQAYQDWKSGAIQTKIAAGLQMAKRYSWDFAAQRMAISLMGCVSRPTGAISCVARRVK